MLADMSPVDDVAGGSDRVAVVVTSVEHSLTEFPNERECALDTVVCDELTIHKGGRVARSAAHVDGDAASEVLEAFRPIDVLVRDDVAVFVGNRRVINRMAVNEEGGHLEFGEARPCRPRQQRGARSSQQRTTGQCC